MTNASVVEVVSETTTTKTTRRSGVPMLIHQLAVVYRLDCEHQITRTKDRTTEPADVGRRMVCEHCTAIASANAEAR